MRGTPVWTWPVRPAGAPPGVGIALLLFLLALATLHMSPQGADAWGWGGVALSAGLCAPLAVAARRPLIAPIVMVGLFLVAQSAYGLVPVFAITLVVTVFTVASSDATARRTLIGVAVLAAVALDAGAELTRHDSWTDSAYLVMATAALGAAAAGDAVRSRRAYVREVEDRAEQAEQAREQHLARRITEERLRIARDMHDLVAHHLAVVSVQSEVARRLIGTRPDVAEQSLGQVHGAASSALDELGSLIGILRHAGDASALPVEPSPDLSQLPALVAAFESTGLQITCSEHGERCRLPPTVDLTAYRLVQESLTNAHKHGGGDATLTIVYAPDAVVIEVVNATSPRTTELAAGGHGLLGMRERVAALGGTLRAERTGSGQFHVRASLPVSGVAAVDV